jgi:hypothetical protein
VHLGLTLARKIVDLMKNDKLLNNYQQPWNQLSDAVAAGVHGFKPNSVHICMYVILSKLRTSEEPIPCLTGRFRNLTNPRPHWPTASHRQARRQMELCQFYNPALLVATTNRNSRADGTYYMLAKLRQVNYPPTHSHPHPHTHIHVVDKRLAN